MKIGIMLGAIPDPTMSIDKILARARGYDRRGFSLLGMAHIRSHDAVMTLGLAGRETNSIELITAVTPIQPRHPTAMAQQALTAAAMAKGRFTLGIGLSHRVVVEDMYGLSFAKPARTMRHYLEALQPMLRGEKAEIQNPDFRLNFEVQINDAPKPVSVLIAALGPMMLKIAGELTDGTILWMTGPKTVTDHIAPRLHAAAAGAGRSAPRIVAGFPVILTRETAKAREQAARLFAVYGQLPSYRAMLDREGVAGPQEMAIIGDETALTAALQRLQDAGVTDFMAVLFDDGTQAPERTLSFLQSSMA